MDPSNRKKQLVGSVQVENFDDGVIFGVVRKPSTASILINAVVTGVFATMLIAAVFGQTHFKYLGVLFAAGSCLYARRSRHYSLSVSHRELIAKGSVGDSKVAARSVCVADLDLLEFQEDQTGPEDGSHPKGLYAVVDDQAICLLPKIDKEEAEGVTNEIFARFPVWREGVRAEQRDISRSSILSGSKPQDRAGVLRFA